MKLGLIFFFLFLVIDSFAILLGFESYRIFIRPFFVPFLFFYSITFFKKRKHNASKVFLVISLFLIWIIDLLYFIDKSFNAIFFIFYTIPTLFFTINLWRISKFKIYESKAKLFSYGLFVLIFIFVFFIHLFLHF